MTKKPTVVIVAHDVGGSGGMERHLEEVVMRLRHDAELIVVAASMKLAETEGIRFIKIPVIPRPIPVKMIVFAILASLRLLFVRKDILHTTGAIVLNCADLSTVHFCHAGYMKEAGNTRSKENKSWLRRLNSAAATRIALWMERWCYRPNRTKRLIAVSGRVRRELLESFPYGGEQVMVVPNGVDIERFRPYDAKEKKMLRRQYGLPEQDTVLLFMGGDWQRKGLHHVIEAFRETVQQRPTVRLAVVGKGEAAPYAAMLPPELKDRVQFFGKQSKPEEWFGLSDVFVFPTSYETFSLVVHEAAAAGLIIMTTQVGGVEDLIDEGIEGLYVEQSGNRIAHVLQRVLSDIESYRSCGANARRRVSVLTWDHTYTKLKQAYRLIEPDSSGNRGIEFGNHHA